MQNEVTVPKQILEGITGAPVTNFAFPNGIYSKNITDLVKNYYSGARGIEPALNGKNDFSEYDIKAENITYNTSLDQIKEWIRQAKENNTWLVLTYHSVDVVNDFEPYNITPDQLESHLQAIKDSGVDVLTMKQALEKVKNDINPPVDNTNQNQGNTGGGSAGGGNPENGSSGGGSISYSYGGNTLPQSGGSNQGEVLGYFSEAGNGQPDQEQAFTQEEKSDETATTTEPVTTSSTSTDQLAAVGATGGNSVIAWIIGIILVISGVYFFGKKIVA